MSRYKKTVNADTLFRITGINPGTLQGTDILSDGDDYTKADAVMLLFVARLAEAGISPSTIARAIQNIHGFKNDTAWLVISTGALSEIIQPSPCGEPGTKPGKSTRVHNPGVLHFKTVKGSKLKRIIKNPKRYVSIIVNLDEIEKHVKAEWPK